MDPVRNPFAPGAGSPPPQLAGRQELLRQAETALLRVSQRRHAQSLILTGLRGVGKTVLLNRIHTFAAEQHYDAVLIEAHEEKSLPELIVPTLRSILFRLDQMGGVNEKVKRAFRVFRSFLGTVKFKSGGFELTLDVDPELGSADSGDLETDLPVLITAVAEAAGARGRSVALLVDELQYFSETELSGLIMGMHRVSQLQLPMILLGAGLPQIAGIAGKSKSYAERLFEFAALGPLSEQDAMTAIEEPITRENEKIHPDATRAIVDASQGYPYFLQEWAYECWNTADKSPITLKDVQVATQKVIHKLDNSFFRVRLDRLTPSEKRYLRAMAERGPGPHRSGDVAETLGVKVSSVAPTRSSLIRKGMVYSPSHGDTAFTVPMFDEFLKRQMPVFER